MQFMQAVRVVDNAVRVAPENVSHNVEVQKDNAMHFKALFFCPRKKPFLVYLKFG